MLDHIGISVADFERSKAFYSKALAPLSIALMMEVSAAQSGASAHAGFGNDGKPFFWIGTGARPSGRVHIAFVAPRRSDVEAFYRAAMDAGGTDNGHRDRGRNTIPIILARLSSIPTAITSRRSAISPNSDG